jgi:hypothetical protein
MDINEFKKSLRKIIEENNDVCETDFPDRVDRDFEKSLYECGVVRNPENDMTLIGKTPTDEGVYDDYVVMYISLEDVKDVLEDMSDDFYEYIDDTKDHVLSTLDNDNLASIIQSIDAYNGYWIDQARYMEGCRDKKDVDEDLECDENEASDGMNTLEEGKE